MRWLALFVLILAAAPAGAQEDEAEKLYRAMEKKVLAAESLAVEFDSQMTVDGKKVTLKGTIYVAAGNKTRLDLKSDLFGIGGKTLIVTNGESRYAKVGDMVFDKGPFPPKGEVLLGLIARFSAANAVLEKKIVASDFGKDFPVKNFKLGVKEMLGKREAQVVQYQIQEQKRDDLAEVSVWIDTKTQLPLSRAGWRWTCNGIAKQRAAQKRSLAFTKHEDDSETSTSLLQSRKTPGVFGRLAGRGGGSPGEPGA
jgi:outer membrane lipoprotein-sorting protein